MRQCAAAALNATTVIPYFVNEMILGDVIGMKKVLNGFIVV